MVDWPIELLDGLHSYDNGLSQVVYFHHKAITADLYEIVFYISEGSLEDIRGAAAFPIITVRLVFRKEIIHFYHRIHNQ